MINLTNITEYYEQLEEIALCDRGHLRDGYFRLRTLFEYLCRLLTQDNRFLITDLAARINLMASVCRLSQVEQHRLHTFRLTSNDILNHRKEPTRDTLLRDVRSVAFFIQRISDRNIPPSLSRLLPVHDEFLRSSYSFREHVDEMRATLVSISDGLLYVRPHGQTSADEAPLPVTTDRWDTEDNSFFQDETLAQYLHTLNLLDIDVDTQGTLHPGLIVFEPDYLLDISQLSECFQPFGHHALNYLFLRLQQSETTIPILIGNIVNLFLDEWVYAREKPDYKICMQKAFRQYALELSACTDLEGGAEKQFFEDCLKHFRNLQTVLHEIFPAPGYDLKPDDAVLEPSFICSALGLQGRLDYMQRDMTSFIEMKSGKADEYKVPNKILPKENHATQMLLYEAVLEFSMHMKHQDVRPYLLYTTYPLLYPARPVWNQVRRAINVRNQIVRTEYLVRHHDSLSFTDELLHRITPDTLNLNQLEGRLWKQFLAPRISSFGRQLDSLSPLERKYFLALYNFTTKELYTSKSGDTSHPSRRGASSLWLSTHEEKCKAGELMQGLRIESNLADDPDAPRLTLSFFCPQDDREDNPIPLPNFRPGDTIILYEAGDTTQDTATSHMVFKGNLEDITDRQLTVRLKAPQRNLNVLPTDSLYAIEHDITDTSFRTMFQGLASFLTATERRRQLLLGTRPPEFDTTYNAAIQTATDDFRRITLKAQAAKDYFLLVGPPGTGKTSRALKSMVEAFAGEGKDILLLSYTNRAIDEICKAVESISPQPRYIRIGNELACEEAYRPHLLRNVLSPCRNRGQVRDLLCSCHIFIGTVSTLSGKSDLFRIKHFDVAIIDESSQILEPQLAGLICQRDKDGKEAIDKFIMIGDHKQLPAVVMQSAGQTEIHDEELRALSLTNLRDSLFERLYRMALEHDDSGRSYDMLCRQGRMNEVIADFPNKAFYRGKLLPVGLDHQHGSILLPEELLDSPYRQIMQSRTGFFPTADKSGANARGNLPEASTAALIARMVYEQYSRSEEGFLPNHTLGIITPYRTQIALIRHEIYKLGIEALNNIMIDTVERYQGSERDVIVYSCCVSDSIQLDFLCNMSMEQGQPIDRKLNVALTRARKQLFVIGNPSVLQKNPIYARLIKSMPHFSIN